jgi:hypothetical protein
LKGDTEKFILSAILPYAVGAIKLIIPYISSQDIIDLIIGE